MKQNIIFLATLALIVCVMTVGMFAFSRPEFSKEENRMLAAAPRPSLEGIASGRYFTRLSAFCSDAVPLRKYLIRAGAVCELALGKRQNNGVIFDGDRLIDTLEYGSTDKLEGRLAALKAYSEGAQSFATAVVPRSVDVCREGEAVDAMYTLVCDSLGEWELCDRLKQGEREGELIYYKTDHHLSADGAYILYEYIMLSLDVKPYSVEEFEWQSFSREFLGSTYSKSGLLPIAYDEIILPRYEGDGDFLVYCEDSGCSLSSLYCFEAGNIKDKYRVFTDGNHGILHVTLKDGEGERPTLLVYKDSFANAVLPMLARHFDLVVCDPRYTDAVPESCDCTAVIIGIDTLNTVG